MTFVVWLLDRGQVSGKGYAPSSASTILAGVVVELRRRGVEVSRDDQAEARARLEAAAVALLKAGERRGRGQAAAAEVPDLYRVVGACPDTLAGARDKVLILTGFHYASRAQDPASPPRLRRAGRSRPRPRSSASTGTATSPGAWSPTPSPGP